MQLTSIQANRHIVEEKPSDRPIRLLLRFADSRSLRIGIAGDRFRVTVDGLPLDPAFDMAEYGQVDIADVTDVFGAHLRGVEVRSLHALTLDGHDVGVRLGFEAGATLNIWVDGDELHWGDAGALVGNDWVYGQAPVVGLPIAL